MMIYSYGSPMVQYSFDRIYSRFRFGSGDFRILLSRSANRNIDTIKRPFWFEIQRIQFF